MAVKEEKPSQSPVLPPSPFSPAMRHDSHKPDSKHSEYSLFFVFGQSWNGVRILNSRISVPACSHSHVIPSVTLSSDRFCAPVSISSQDPLPGYLSCKCVSPTGLDLKSMDGSRPGSRLPDSPAPPCSQQDIKIKQEPKTPIAPKKTQVCEETTMLLETLQPHRTFVWFVCDLSSSI